jgi:hypothetical protein
VPQKLLKKKKEKMYLILTRLQKSIDRMSSHLWVIFDLNENYGLESCRKREANVILT